MKNYEELHELLDTIKENGITGNVLVQPGSRAVIHMGKSKLELSSEECKLLFDTVDTVESFIGAVDKPEGANLELFDLDIPDDVKSALEAHFSTVDEL